MSKVIDQPKTEESSTNLAAQPEQHDILDQLLKPEVQELLNTLIEQLPKLSELVNLLTKAYDFAQLVATDELLKKDTVGAIQEIAVPVKDTIKNIAATVIEAKDQAEESNEVIGLFGLLKMIKDPQAQKCFRLINALLKVSAEKAAK